MNCEEARRKTLKAAVMMVLVFVLLITAGCATVRQNKTLYSRTVITNLYQALELYRFDMGRYPNEEEGPAVLLKPDGSGRSGYVDALPLDPWGKAYRSRLIAGNPAIDSAGADGIFDTADDVTVRQ
jgi:general secretion pathway protein G